MSGWGAGRADAGREAAEEDDAPLPPWGWNTPDAMAAAQEGQAWSDAMERAQFSVYWKFHKHGRSDPVGSIEVATNLAWPPGVLPPGWALLQLQLVPGSGQGLPQLLTLTHAAAAAGPQGAGLPEHQRQRPVLH